jgi:hypothetical protein
MKSDEIKDLKLEIIRLKSLCLRAAQEIKDLDSTIMHAADSVDGLKEWLGLREDDMQSGISSTNLINRLEGRTRGGYVENFRELSKQRKEIESDEGQNGSCLTHSDCPHASILIDLMRDVHSLPSDAKLDKKFLLERLVGFLDSVRIEG